MVVVVVVVVDVVVVDSLCLVRDDVGCETCSRTAVNSVKEAPDASVTEGC